MSNSTLTDSFHLRQTVFQYINLTKPKIIVLLALTGMVAYILPATGQFSYTDLIVFLLLGVFSAGGAMAINNIVDRDIDEVMERTKNRASVGQDALTSWQIFTFGGLLVGIGVTVAWLYFGIFTALHLAWGALFYIFGYTLLLKRHSSLNTILGGLASPAPVWAAYAARYEIIGEQGGFLGVPLIGWLLGWLVFFWTPTHTWAMAVKNYEDYSKVNIPILPISIGIEKTATITLYIGVALIGYAIWVTSFISTLSIILSIPIHLLFIRSLIRFYRDPTITTGTSCFKWHNIWLGVLFLLFL